MKTNYHANMIDNDNKREKELEKLAQKVPEKGYSKVLNLFGVKAYYDMTMGTPVEEQSFPTLSGLEVNPKDTISFKEGIERGKRLEKVGNLAEKVNEIQELIEKLENNGKTR